MISHSAIFKLEPTSGGRVVYAYEDNIVYNNINSSLQPGIPVLQLTSYTEDSLTRFQWILGTALQKNLKKRRKVTSIRNKKPRKIKKTKCREISVPAAAEEIRIQRKGSKRRKQSEESLRKPHCSKFQLHLFHNGIVREKDLLGLQTALLGQRKDE